jgi:rubrerythrin
MVLRFNADEVFEMAIKIERNGGAFYRKAAEINPEGRDLLLMIADQEDEHLNIFEGLRKDLSSRESEPTVFDPENEVSVYLKAMADGHVFDITGSVPSKILRGEESLEEIIRIAIQAEKDTITFFIGMKELVPESLGKDRLDILIREEMKHIKWLSERLA